MKLTITAIIKSTFAKAMAFACLFFASQGLKAQTPPVDFNVPVGFATVNTGSTYPEFNGPVTGGQNATDTFWINGPADFDTLAWHLYYRNRAYRNLSGTNGVPKAPLVIVFMPGEYPEGASSSSAWGNHMMTIQEQGDLTIIGKENVTLKFGFNIKRSWNILIRNITFQDYYDDGVNIGETETHHIWIDHCTLGHPTTMPSNSDHPDGGVDIKAGASYVTVSWCKFRNSWKTSLAGHSDNNGTEDEGKLKVTYYANYFYNTNSRNPRVRFGEIHVLNNLLEKVGLYGSVAAKDAKLVVEGNFYLNTRWPMYADRTVADFQAVYGNNTDGVFTSKTGNLPATYLKQFNNEYDDSGLPAITAQINPAMLNPGGRSVKFDELNAAAAFDPHSYYTYTPYTASEVRTLVPIYAGADAVNFFGPEEGTVITVIGALNSFSQIVGTPSATQSYAVSGVELTSNITITPPAEYEVSADDGTTWHTNVSPLTLIPSGGSVATTVITVRLNAAVQGNYSGNITHESTGATTKNVAVSGITAADAGSWTIYHANELPNAFAAAPFVTSQQSNPFSNTIVPDPEQAGNNLLYMETGTTASSGNNQWRQNLAAGTDKLTLAIRAKGLGDATLIFDCDLDFGSLRWQTRILANGNYGVATGTGENGSSGSLGVDPLEWNIYRFVRNGANAALYINEDPTPVYTATAASGSQNYFRFGDGWGSNNMNSHIDWVVWDATGAYSPSEAALPAELFDGNDPLIEINSSFAGFEQTIGSPSDIQTYTVSGSNLTDDITITPPAGYEVSADAGTTWFTNASPLALAQTGGTVAATTVSVRLNAALAGSYEGDLIHSSAGAEMVSVLVSGTATENTGDWTIYEANELPDVFADAPFVTAGITPSGTNTAGVNTILDDADNVCNKVLQMLVPGDEAALTAFQWRQNLTAADELTVVFKVKGVPDKQLALDLDMDFSGTRSRISLRTDDNRAQVRNGSGGTGTVTMNGITMTDWNIFRFTKTDTEVRLYVNENPDPILTSVPAAAGSNSYFRFGDGDNGATMGSLIDWIIWDVTGAYSPTEAGVPADLLAGCGSTEPVINVNESLGSFAQTVGTPSDVQTYTVSGTNLTDNVIIIPPVGYEVSADGGTTWFTNAPPLVLVQTGGTVEETIISVRLNATVAGDYTGAIVHSSLDAADVAISVTGAAVSAPSSGDWTIYEANELPDAFADAPFVTAGITPSGTNTAGVNTILDDADNVCNKVLQMLVPGDEAALTAFQWRQNLTAADELTVVFKVKGVPDKQLALDLDMDFSGTRSRISLRTDDNRAQVRNGSGGTGTVTMNGITMTDWNIFRFTKTGTEVRLYVNENPDPILTSVPAAAGSNSYFRFGDGDNGATMGSLIDWIIWDTTGAYSPTALPLPDDILPCGGGNELNGVIYEANELPDVFAPAPFVTAGITPTGTNTAGVNTVIEDADNSCNKVLQMLVPGDEATLTAFQWRQNFTPIDELTVVFKIKGAPGRQLALDLDMDFSGTRSRISLRTDDNRAQVRNGSGGTGTVTMNGITMTDWNIFRFTKTDTEVRLYVNENPDPILTSVPAAAGSNSYFRFGDGDNGATMGSLIDWIIWDTTGAYSPAEAGVPAGLLAGCEPGNAVINVNASLAGFTQIIGSPSGVQTYTVSGAELTGDITITPPAGYEISADAGTTWFTNTTPLVLTQTGGTVASTSIAVRLNADALGSHSGNIVHTSAGAETKNVAVSGTTNPPPPPTIVVTSSLSPFSQIIGAPSVSQTYTVSGIELTDNITITPPAGYEVSADGGTTWFTNTTPLVLTQTGGIVPVVTLAIRLNAAVVGSYDGDIAHISSGAATENVAVTGAAITIPEIVVTSLLSSFQQTLGAASAVQTYTVSGVNLEEAVVITPPAGYEISADGGVTWVTNASSISLAHTAGILTARTISVRLNATAMGSYSGNIIHTTVGGAAQNVNVAGVVVNPPAIMVTAALAPFEQTLGTPSHGQLFTVQGNYLVGDIVLTAPAGYELSFNNISWSNVLSLPGSSGTVAVTNVRVRLNATTTGTHTGMVVISSNGHPDNMFAVQGYTYPSLKIAPNPVSDRLNLFHDNLFTPGDIYIYNSGGQVVRQQKSTPASGRTQIDIRGLPGGIYTLKFVRGEEQAILQFVKH